MKLDLANPEHQVLWNWGCVENIIANPSKFPKADVEALEQRLMDELLQQMLSLSGDALAAAVAVTSGKARVDLASRSIGAVEGR